MANVDLVYFDAGGGHRAAAQALQALIAEQRRPWTVRLVDLFAVLDAQQRLRRWFGGPPEQLYNRRLASGWTIGMRHELKLLQAAIRLAHGPMLRTLQRHWQTTQPDLVVSLVPNFNRVLGESVASAAPGTPFVTVMTDLADHPPRFWIEPRIDQHIVCGSTKAVEQALAMGVPPGRIERVSGMMLRPAFHRTAPVDRAVGRTELGLIADRPTGLVMSGGQGSMQMLDLARAMPDVQLILLCGHHARLLEQLRALQRPVPHAALPFTPDVPRLMQLADFFVGKPGPGCLSEAVQMGLPIVTLDNAWTLPQERWNARWVQDEGLGVVVDSWRGVPRGVRQLLGSLPAYRERVGRIENRAVFEVVDLLARRLAERPMPAAETLLLAA